CGNAADRRELRAGGRRLETDLDHRLVREHPECSLVTLLADTLPPGVKLPQDREAAWRKIARSLDPEIGLVVGIGRAPPGRFAADELLACPFQPPHLLERGEEHFT